MLNMIRNKKKHLVTAGLSILIWLVTFYTDTKIFSADGLNMNCLPIDTEMVLPMHILTKILVLLCLFCLSKTISFTAFSRLSGNLRDRSYAHLARLLYE